MDFRSALESYLIGNYEDFSKDEVLNEVCAGCKYDVALPDEWAATVVNKNILSKEATVGADFLDDEGIKRLRIKTMTDITGLKYEEILHHLPGNLDDRFVDAMDFISLNKQNFINNKIVDKLGFAKAQQALVDYAPEEVAGMFKQLFSETFGEIPYDYMDESGEEYITSDGLARFLNERPEDVELAAKEAISQGLAKVVPSIPDPKDGNTH